MIHIYTFHSVEKLLHTHTYTSTYDPYIAIQFVFWNWMEKANRDQSFCFVIQRDREKILRERDEICPQESRGILWTILFINIEISFIRDTRKLIKISNIIYDREYVLSTYILSLSAK